MVESEANKLHLDESRQADASFLVTDEEKVIIESLKAKPLTARDLLRSIKGGRLWRVVRPALETRGFIFTREVRVQQGRRKYYYLSEGLWSSLLKTNSVTASYQTYLERMAGRHMVFGERAKAIYGEHVQVKFFNNSGRERRPDLIHTLEDGRVIIVEYERATNPKMCLDHLIGSLGRGIGVLIVCGTRPVLDEYTRLISGPWQRELLEMWGAISVTTANEYFSGGFTHFEEFAKRVVWSRLEPQSINVAKLTRIEARGIEPVIYFLEGNYLDPLDEKTMRQIKVRFRVETTFLNSYGRACSPRDAPTVTGSLKCPLKTCPRPDFDAHNPERAEYYPHFQWMLDYVLDYVGSGRYPELEGILRIHLDQLYVKILDIEAEDEWKKKIRIRQVTKTNGRFTYICMKCRSAVCSHTLRLRSRLDAYMK
jgi:hypothetical protein